MTLVCIAASATVILTSLPVYAADDFSWSPPLGAVAETTADDALIVVLITNDVAGDAPWKGLSAKRELCWCERSFRRSVARIPAGYFNPAAPIQFQHWAIGLPPIVTGGGGQDIERAISIVTDGQYRVLALSVGVPDGDDLTRLIEDAEDTRLLMRRYSTERNEMTQQLADRTRGRLTRMWQIELDERLAALGETDVDPVTDLLVQTELLTSKVTLQLVPIASQLQGVYLKDVQMRFGLTDASDLKRLVILEQHSDTRAAWATTLLPFIVGADLRLLYTDIAEIVWHRSVMPIERSDQDATSATTLADWVLQRGDNNSFAFRISAPLMSQRDPSQRFEVADVARRRGLGWQDLDDAINAGPIRQVTPGELAAWLSQTQGKPLDLEHPTRVRFLFFRSSKDSPYPIREGSPPGRAITMIRQVRK